MNMSQLLSHALKVEVIHIRGDSLNSEIIGQFFHKGRIYDYSIRDDNLECFLDKKGSNYMTGYYSSLLSSLGTKFDSLDPVDYFDYLEGYSRFDGDKCVEGVPCGGRCLPKGYRCRLGDRLKHRVMQLKENYLLNSEDESNAIQKHLESKRGQFGPYGKYAPESIASTRGTTASSIAAGVLNAANSYAAAKNNEVLIKREERRRERLAAKKAKLYGAREALIKNQGENPK